MRIGIDISQVIYQTGVSVYTRNLVENLLKIDSDNEYLLFGGSLRRKKDLETFTNSLKGNYSTKNLTFPPSLADLVWNRLHLVKFEKLVGGVDVYHSSDWAQAPSDSFKVATVHDLAPLLYPKLTRPEIVSVHTAKMKHIISEVDRIIVPSEATKEDVVGMKVDSKKVIVIPEGVDPTVKPSSKKEITKTKRKFNIKKPYLYAVGVGPRKNTQGIIQAYKKIVKDLDCELVIVGHDHYDYGRSEGVIFTGQVDQDDYVNLYSYALMLVFPSLYEGFGLPIVEAFATNCPVVTSNVSSLPEVAGDAAVLVNPNSSKSIAEGIIKANNMRETLIQKGKERVKHFSWEKTAKMTLDVYKEAQK